MTSLVNDDIIPNHHALGGKHLTGSATHEIRNFPLTKRQQDGKPALHKKLMLAIQQKNLDAVKSIVHKFRPNLNYGGSQNSTPLLAAVKEAQLDMAQFLLEQGADPNQAADDYNSGLHYACCRVRGSVDMLRLLLSHGANVNVINYNGNTALHMACMEGQMTLVDCLLEFGADTAVESQRGQSALTIACHAGHTALVQRLLRANADPCLPTRYGSSITVVMRSGNLETLQTLIESSSFHPDKRLEHDGSTMVHVAASLGKLEFLEWVLRDMKCNPNARDNSGKTPLHVLCQGVPAGFLVLQNDRKVLECLQLLVQAGADLHAKDDEGNAPIHYAAQREAEICLQTLLEMGASPDTVDCTGKTSLHLVCCCNVTQTTQNANCIRLLAKAGANINATDKNGNAPIHHVKHADIVEILMDFGAQPNLRNKDDQTVLHLYCSSTHSVHTGSRPTKQPKFNEKRDDLGEHTPSTVVSMLCSRGADVLVRDVHGNLPMFYAAAQGDNSLHSALFEMVRMGASGGLFESLQGCVNTTILRHASDDNETKQQRSKRRKLNRD